MASVKPKNADRMGPFVCLKDTGDRYSRRTKLFRLLTVINVRYATKWIVAAEAIEAIEAAEAIEALGTVYFKLFFLPFVALNPLK
ncbi:hypothetical protein A7K91_02705 [Paenibacillus oryzae]|uniref:Uncharacterized protein n=1 Tax=Paenibacillus oryzae TaxID=1844972 RepID=A0A1A5YV90_9BACL|nr:hypothetical protein A7K91_02705 [Paenibacillus oryzae]